MWHHTDMGLYQMHGQFVNASIYCKALTKYQHPPPSHPQHLPHKHNPIKYGVQVPLPKDTAPLISAVQCKHVQEIVGTLLYYALAVDPTLTCVLSSIAAKQTNGTASVLDTCH